MKHIVIYEDDANLIIDKVTSMLICTTPPTMDRYLILPLSRYCNGMIMNIKSLFDSANYYTVIPHQGDKLDGIVNGRCSLDSPYESIVIKCVSEIGWVIISSY